MSTKSAEQISQQIAAAYYNDPGGAMELRSYFLKPRQCRIIDLVAETTGRGKAEIIREALDEWIMKQMVGGK